MAPHPSPARTLRGKTVFPASPRSLHALRLRLRAQGYSLRKVARELRISHGLLLFLEKGERTITPELEERIRHLDSFCRDLEAQGTDPDPDAIQIVSSFPLPRVLYILRPVVCCKVCGRAFVARDRRQRLCSADCRQPKRRKKK